LIVPAATPARAIAIASKGVMGAGASGGLGRRLAPSVAWAPCYPPETA
jgi:hypothetical protein